ncbi:hypothetical protein WME73_48065 [Sorangium sp. So ce302]|uniref:hypothetical protein n=1 Tax=Sorangium sp. So ce302 TaxID=3133297 RepID=UPI003F62E453
MTIASAPSPVCGSPSEDEPPEPEEHPKAIETPITKANTLHFEEIVLMLTPVFAVYAPRRWTMSFGRADDPLRRDHDVITTRFAEVVAGRCRQEAGFALRACCPDLLAGCVPSALRAWPAGNAPQARASSAWNQRF